MIKTYALIIAHRWKGGGFGRLTVVNFAFFIRFHSLVGREMDFLTVITIAVHMIRICIWEKRQYIFSLGIITRVLFIL